MRFNIISLLNLVLPMAPLFQVSPPKLSMHFCSPYTCHIRGPSPPPFHHPNNTLHLVQIMKFLIMQFFPFLCYFLPLRPKYPPQHPILDHSQPMFLPQCDRPSFPPIQNNGQNYVSAIRRVFFLCRGARYEMCHFLKGERTAVFVV